jgi:hypothetical protein
MSQTSINAAGQPQGVAGQLADNAEVVDVVSFFSEESSAEIPFGVGVVAGSDEQGCLLPSGSGDVCVGVSVFGLSHLPANSAGTSGDLGSSGLLPNAGLQVLRKGRILAYLDKSVTSITPYSDRPFLRYTADGTTNPQVGAWGKETDSGKNTDMSKCAVFVSGMFTSADGTTKCAVMEVDFTNKP